MKTSLLIFTLDYVPNLAVGVDAPDGVWVNGVGGAVEDQSCGDEKTAVVAEGSHAKPAGDAERDSLCWLMSMRMEMRLV